MTASTVAATFIATEGAYLEAVIEVDGQRLHVMDEFGGAQLAAGTQVRLELSPMPSERDDWDAIFTSNPGREKRLLRLDGWRYLAQGVVVSVDPVVCDCGLLQRKTRLQRMTSAAWARMSASRWRASMPARRKIRPALLPALYTC